MVTLVQALRLCTGRTAHRGSRGIALPFHDHGTTRGWGVSVTPRPLFTPGKDPVPIVQEAGVGPRAGLDRCGKSRPPRGFDLWTFQPVASCYTDYATWPTDGYELFCLFDSNTVLDAISSAEFWFTSWHELTSTKQEYCSRCKSTYSDKAT